MLSALTLGTDLTLSESYPSSYASYGLAFVLPPYFYDERLYGKPTAAHLLLVDGSSEARRVLTNSNTLPQRFAPRVFLVIALITSQSLAALLMMKPCPIG